MVSSRLLQGCNASLTIRNFHLAALDDKNLDPMTRRPRKVLVCKDHVPMPKASLNVDALTFRHTTSVPKPSIPGLHRSMMGERGGESKEGESVFGYYRRKTGTPKSLDQGSHAEILKDSRAQEKRKDKGCYTPTTTTIRTETTSTTTLPKYRQDQFTISAVVSDPTTVSYLATGETQDPVNDDDSFRTLPVRHSDYEYQQDQADSWDDDTDVDDNKQERAFMMKSTITGDETATDVVKEVDMSLEDLVLSSKLMEHNKHRRHESAESFKEDQRHKAAAEDEWGTTPTDDLGRREVIAGM
ncbi:hypothetical protein BGZ65_005546 [Modicella reniformis]|uniref:Uncharacterized protein n=1 Tax=Modicella reniformis TaxID=1440133 RepID=A0A9P6ML84_9FUNG|nr:hypothetical protein BGZ65_005546 [Modicella reniformis]